MKYCCTLLIVLTAGISACSPLTTINRNPESPVIRPEIAFGTFSAFQVPQDSCIIRMREIRFATGHVKENPQNRFLYPVEVTLEDSLHHPIGQFLIEHPLIEDYEYADDQGRLQRLVSMRDSATFHIRFNRPPTAIWVRFRSNHTSMPVINTLIRLNP